MVLPMVDTTADRLPVTMDDLNAQAILATGLSLVVVEPLREGLVQWIAVTTAEEILGSMMTELCERRHGTQEGPSVGLPSGNLEIREMSGTREIIVIELITVDILCHLLWSLGEHPQALVWHRSILPSNVTCCRPVGTKDWRGQMFRPRDHRLPIFQPSLTGLRSTQHVQH